MTDYMLYAQKLTTVPRPAIQHFESWQPPCDGFLKINFDVWIVAANKRGLGMVIRNDRDNILMMEPDV